MPTRKSMRRSGGRPALRSTRPFCTSIAQLYGVDHAAKLDEDAVAGSLNGTTAMRIDGGIDQIAPHSPEARQRAILVR